ncbi:MutH/Sau3AI family endonuclease [candidate division KSB1 bacterium]
MTRDEAVNRLSEIKGIELSELANSYGITIYKNGKLNKGWGGMVAERVLGLKTNSAQSADFGDWELKTFPVHYLKNGNLSPKETMAITMINPDDVLKAEFEESHLYEKLRKLVVAVIVYDKYNVESSWIYKVAKFDIENPEIFNQIKDDYNEVRSAIRNCGFQSLTGKMGVYCQPRTKGPGHGSTSRAFYLRIPFLKKHFIE